MTQTVVGWTHEDLLRKAYRLAGASRDRSTHNAALLIDPRTGRVLAQGWNDIHFPVKDKPERRVGPAKYQFTEHAERATLFHAARRGLPTYQMTLVCPWAACADCARAIVACEVGRLVRHRHPGMAGRPDWEASVAAGDEMLAEAGVEVVEVDVRLDCSVLFGGRLITV